MAQFCGTLVVRVDCVTPISLDSKRKYLVHITMPEPQLHRCNFRTPSVPVSTLPQLHYAAEFPLQQKLLPNCLVKVLLLREKLFSTENVADGVLCLDPLLDGTKIASADVTMTTAKKEEVCKVVMSVEWKDGNVPDMLPPPRRIDGRASEQTLKSNVPNGPAISSGIQLPPCEGHDFALHVRIHKARNLQSGAEDTVYDARVKVGVLHESQITEVAESTNNPIFEEDLSFQFDKVKADFWTQNLLITVLDHHTLIPDSVIGEVQLELGNVYSAGVSHTIRNAWLALHRSVTDGQVMGFLKISVTLLNARTDAPVEMDFEEDDAEDEDAIVNNLVSGPGTRFEEICLHSDIIRAEGVPDMDVTGGCDAYVRLQFGNQARFTYTVNKSLTPQWNTAVNLPLLLPSLTNTLVVTLWDSDFPLKDDLIGTRRFSFGELMAHGRGGLPYFPPQWINFYGSPREGAFGGFNKHYQKMDSGEVEGLFFRGRVLLRMTGSRMENTISMAVPIKEIKVKFVAVVQLLQFSMLPKGSFCVRASVGTIEATSPTKKGKDMAGVGTGLTAIYFGEELRVAGELSVVVHEDDEDVPVAPQIPDIILHLTDSGGEVLAATRYSVCDLLNCTEGVHSCRTWRILDDPEKVCEGEQPTQPMGQVYVGFYLTAAEPQAPSIPIRGSIVMPGISSHDLQEYAIEACVHQARQIPSGDENGLSDPFVRINWATGCAQTGTKLETLNPIFNEMVLCYADAKPRFPDIVVELWDWDAIGRNTFLCKTVVPFEDAEDPTKAGKRKWYGDFYDSRGKRVHACELLLSFEVVRLVSEKVKEKFKNRPKAHFLKKLGSTAQYEGYAIPKPKAIETSTYSITCSVFSLRNMRKYHLMEIKNPSVEVELAGFCVDIPKVSGSNPDFNREFSFCVDLPSDTSYLPQLNFRVYDNRLGPRVLIGSAVVSLEDDRCNPAKKSIRRVNLDEEVVKRHKKILESKGAHFAGLITGTTQLQPANVNLAKAKAAARMLAVHAKLRGTSQQPEQQKGEKGFENHEMHHLSQGEDLDQPLIPNSKVVSPASPTMEASTDATVGIPIDTEEARNIVLRLVNAQADLEEAKATECDDVDDEELTWIDRFDPDQISISPKQIVTRLGKLQGILPPGKTTLEDYYGPFDADAFSMPLFRGWGAQRKKCGAITFDVLCEKLPPTAKKDVLSKDIELRRTEVRQPCGIMARVYVVRCKNLAAKDNSLLTGHKSDPYIVLSLVNQSNSRDNVTVRCDKQKQYQELNPEFFLMRELHGVIPKQNLLRVEVWDWDRIGKDELIGFTEIDMESRFFSHRGYSGPGKAFLEPGSVTESRILRNDVGQIQGSVEMWVDIFDEEHRVGPVPRPIDIAPPPPIEMELRVVVWNTRDVIMVDESINEEAMTDIYVRCWMDGMDYNVQNTDVHYRSLDGTGNFNWRMVFPFVFDPRTKRTMPVSPENTLMSFFRIRKEQKKHCPVLHVQIFDNDLFPGTDDFIGEANLNLLKLTPTVSHRDKETLLGVVLKDVSRCCNFWPFNACCIHKVRPDDADLTLQQRQRLAAFEARSEREMQLGTIRRQVSQKLKLLAEAEPFKSDPARLEELRKRLTREAWRNARANLFADFLPAAAQKHKNEAEKQRALHQLQDTDKSVDSTADKKGQEESSEPKKGPSSEQPATAGSSTTQKPAEAGTLEALLAKDEYPVMTETPKFWFACRGPNGGGRVGDVQVSFQLVRKKAIEANKALEVGTGRSAPHALPEPSRPDSSFFWLSSPWKSAVHILWKNYKWYILTLLCIAVSALLLYVFVSEGTRVKARNFFEPSGGTSTK